VNSATRGRQPRDEPGGVVRVLCRERREALVPDETRQRGLRQVVGRAFELRDRGFEPLQVHVFAIDHVLVRVVRVVLRDLPRDRDMTLPERELVAVEIP
jgi:hypothetical protein